VREISDECLKLAAEMDVGDASDIPCKRHLLAVREES
jgi:hypothetical protein